MTPMLSNNIAVLLFPSQAKNAYAAVVRRAGNGREPLGSHVIQDLDNTGPLMRRSRCRPQVNNARGAIVDQDAVVEALESGQLGGVLLAEPSRDCSTVPV